MKFCVPKELDLLPPNPNEVLTRLKTNKFGDVTCMKYRSTMPCIVLDGVWAMLEQIQVKPPRSPSPSSSSSGPKRKRISNTDLEKQIEALLESNENLTQASAEHKKQVADLTHVDDRNKHSIATLSAMIGRLTGCVDKLDVKYTGLKAKHNITFCTLVNLMDEMEEKEKKKEKK